MTDINKDFNLFARANGVPTTTMESYAKQMNSFINPTIIEERRMNVASMDVFSRLFMERILFLGSPIDSDVANIINSQLLFLEMSDPKSPISVYINSPGGSVYDGMSIYDVFNYVSCPIQTTCIGTAASMGAVLLSSGDKGARFALPHSQVMIHQPSQNGGGHITAADMKIAFEEMEKCKDMIYKVLSENTDKPIEEIARLCDRDKWYTAKEAVDFGLIDSVIVKN